MNLPVLNTPTYEMEIPSTGEKIKYRQFLVKEQKLLMMAQESGDEAAQMRTVGEIVKNCTFNKIDKPDAMATFDIEYMWTDDIGITMKYPNLDMVKKFTNTANITEVSFEMIKSCIQNIFDKDQVYDEMSDKDLQNFIEQMNTEQFEKLTQFFDTMPKLSHSFKVKNPNTGVESDIVLEGLDSFLE